MPTRDTEPLETREPEVLTPGVRAITALNSGHWHFRLFFQWTFIILLPTFAITEDLLSMMGDKKKSPASDTGDCQASGIRLLPTSTDSNRYCCRRRFWGTWQQHENIGTACISKEAG